MTPTCPVFVRLLALVIIFGEHAFNKVNAEELVFPLGIYGPFTSITQSDLAVAILFDLDLRKNWEPALRERFGEPILAVPDLHPDLRLKLQVGSSDSSKKVGVETTLDWFMGVNGFDKVIGFVGGYFSAIALAVASNSEVFNLPQIAYGATSPHLSDKAFYPWFSRSCPPDSVQGAAMWSWMNTFRIPSVAFFYRQRESYGEGLLQAALNEANSAGQSGRVSGIGVEMTDDDDADLLRIQEGLERLRSTGSKFVIIVFSDPVEITITMYAMEQEGSLYNGYQLLGPDAFHIVVHSKYRPSRGYAVGTQRFTPVTQGPLFPKFLEMWRLLTPDDIYGAEAMERYKLGLLRAPLATAAAANLTLADFQVGMPWFFSAFLFDAAYTFVHAISSLLNQGEPSADIYGARLLDEVRRTSFEGATGFIQFDENADRIGDYELWNVLVEGGELESVATWSALSREFAFRSTAELTWANGTVSDTAPAWLVACSPGQRWDDIEQVCITCPANWFSPGGVGAEARCTACDAGRVGNSESAATGCLDCSVGSFRSITGERCEECPRGTFGADVGQSACLDCPVGRYASLPGQRACEVCGEGKISQALFATMAVDPLQQELHNRTEYTYVNAATSEAFCGCDRGARQDSDGECIFCTEGLICKGLSDVTIAEGYYADTIIDGQLKVFKCHGKDQRCSGGVAGDTCAAGRSGISCAECIDGMRAGADGACVDCTTADSWPAIVILVLAVGSLVVMYYLLDRFKQATQSQALLLCACALGQLVTVTQQLGVVGLVSLQWKEPIASILSGLSLLTFNIEVTRFTCVSPQGPVTRFAIKLFIIFVTTGLMLCIHAASVVCFYQRRFRERMHVLVGVVGSLFMVFNIAVTSTVLQPFQCQSHPSPNDLWTTRAYPSIICWESSDHWRMLILGGVAFVTVPVVFLVACTVVIRKLPAKVRAGDAAFLQAFAFLFVRFRNTRHFYVLLHILRSFLVAVVLVIPDIFMQIVVLDVVLLAGFSATLFLWPWRVEQANYLDCAFGAFTLLFTCIMPVFLPEEEKSLASAAWLASALVIISISLTPLAVLYGVYLKLQQRHKRFQFFLCHHKNASGAYSRFLKMHLLELPNLSGKVFLDADDLDNLDYLFEHVANDTSTLVVICTPEIFTRPFCVGEMCVARLKHIPTLGVLLPSAILPDETFVSQLEDRITNLEILTECGISADVIATTLLWVRTQTMIEAPAKVNDAALAFVSRRLRSVADSIGIPSARKGDGASASPSPVDNAPVSFDMPREQHSISIFDRSNMEAAATAFILKKFILPHLSDVALKIPEPLEEATIQHPPSVALVVCTQGAFDNRDMLKVLMSLSNNATSLPSLTPVISDPSFRFPPSDCRAMLLALGFKEEEAEAISSIMATLFKEIAINFVAQHYGEGQLEVAAKDLARRLHKASRPTPLSMGFLSNTLTVDTGTTGVDYRPSSKPADSSPIAARRASPQNVKPDPDADADVEVNFWIDDDGVGSEILRGTHDGAAPTPCQSSVWTNLSC